LRQSKQKARETTRFLSPFAFLFFAAAKRISTAAANNTNKIKNFKRQPRSSPGCLSAAYLFRRLTESRKSRFRQIQSSRRRAKYELLVPLPQLSVLAFLYPADSTAKSVLKRVGA
jgi:hypothetical protein